MTPDPATLTDEIRQRAEHQERQLRYGKAPSKKDLASADIIRDLLSREAQLRDALQTYGQHTDGCDLARKVLGSSRKRACTCGLDALLSSPRTP